MAGGDTGGQGWASQQGWDHTLGFYAVFEEKALENCRQGECQLLTSILTRYLCLLGRMGRAGGRKEAMTMGHDSSSAGEGDGVGFAWGLWGRREMGVLVG